jgi:hypothetical protein
MLLEDDEILLIYFDHKESKVFKESNEQSEIRERLVLKGNREFKVYKESLELSVQLVQNEKLEHKVFKESNE